MFEVRGSDGGGGRLRVDSDEGGFPVHSLQSVVGSLRRRLDVVVLVVGEPVAEPLVVQPLLPQAEVEHGECAIACDLLVNGQELWQSGGKIELTFEMYPKMLKLTCL